MANLGGSRLHSARSSSLLEAPSDAEFPDAALSERVRRLLDGLADRRHVGNRVIGDFELPASDMGRPIVVRRALAFALLLREMPIFIQDDELLVGGRTVFGEPREPSLIFPGLSGAPSISYFPRYASPNEEEAAGMRAGAASNHNAIGYGRALKMGLGGLRAYAATQRERLATDASALPDLDRRLAFLDAVDVTLAAVGDYARRYAALARTLADGAADAGRRGELAAIADACDWVATERPRDFREALQLFLFIRVASLVESYGCMPLGRFDQYLWPFLAADLDLGRIGRSEARELLECLFIKLNQEIDLSSTDDCQRIMLSGQTADGRDATNELSYLCLESASRLRLPSPKVGVRLHAGTPDAFFRRVVGTVRLGIAGLPELYNDESIIAGFRRIDIPMEHALDYAHDGCAEVTLPGRSDFYPTWTSVRLLKVLVETLPDIPNDASWADLLATYKERLATAIAASADRGNRRDTGLGAISPAPFMSATLEGCLESGLDKTWGGTTYNFTGLLGSELVNAANSLAAIRQVVYEEGDVSLAALKTALASDFAGLDGERLRLRLKNRCPKFGNDDDRVDDIAADLAAHFIAEGERYTNPRGGRFVPGFFDFAGYIVSTKGLAASPDGRHAGESTSGHLAPVGGTDRQGVTANLRSMSRVTSLHPPMGTMFDVKLHPSAVRGEGAATKLGALIRTYMSLDGKALQFNVIDAATLRAAQRDPEKYRDLLVRVWGFSAYFVELSSDFQEHIIGRTEHAL